MYLILQPKKVIWDLLYFDWNSFFIMWNSNPEHIFISLKLMFFQRALGQRSAKRMKYIGKAHCWGFFVLVWWWGFCGFDIFVCVLLFLFGQFGFFYRKIALVKILFTYARNIALFILLSEGFQVIKIEVEEACKWMYLLYKDIK